MTVLYLLARRLLKRKLSAGAYYLLAKAAVLYFLVPLPFLKGWYRDLIPTALLERRMGLDRISLTWTNFMVHAQGSLHVNSYAVIQAAVALIWLLGACVKLAKKLNEYVDVVRWHVNYAKKEMTERERAFAESLRKKYGVRRRVSFLQVRVGDPTITFGVLRPIIICGREVGTPEAEILAGHEMTHIRRWDVLWKILMEAASLLHWWNPLMKRLDGDFEILCECSCDEVALRKRTKEEVNAYMRLMIEEAQDKKPERTSMSWEAGFGNQTKEIVERVDNLMKKNKWNRLAAGALVAALIFGNSMTVFAYRDGYSAVMPEDTTQEEVAHILDDDFTEFATDGVEWEEVQGEGIGEEIVLHYEKEFVDEEGNVYPVPEDESAVPYCNHSYVSGEARNHHPYSDGSCEMRYYNAERCVRCGQVIYHDLINIISYMVCPH